MAILLIVNTLFKIYIPRDAYDNYVSSYYDRNHVETLKLQFKPFTKNRMKELEHTNLITEWTRNPGQASYKAKSEKKTHINNHKINRSFITIIGNTGQIVINMSVCGFSFRFV